MFDPTVTYDDLAWIRDQWPGKVVVKGVQTVDDARRLADVGVDGDRCCPTTAAASSTAPRSRSTCCPTSSREVGNDTEVHLDTGIMSGADIVAAVALGAHFTLDRPRLPLRADGRRRAGVDRADRRSCRAGRAHHAPARRHLPGRTDPAHVTQLVRLAPRPRPVNDLVR